jgi:pilus assembly protein FimV
MLWVYAVSDATRYPFRKRAATLAVASCLSVLPLLGEAASLGKLTVLSGLGQPLRAEVELGADREELMGMAARLAPLEVFKQSGLDFVPALRDMRFAIEKRANGTAVLKLSTAAPINEPFLDFLVELNWPAGRVVREYTFLLDPPELTPKGAAPQISVAEAKVPERIKSAATVAAPRPAAVEAAAAPKPAREKPAKIAAEADAEPKPKPVAKEKAVSADGGLAGEIQVKTGDTLGKIAAAHQYDGVSLEQMLVALYRHNESAFLGKNLNRLKTGAILGLPDRAEVEAIPADEARKVFRAQANDWNAYRQKLAQAAGNAAPREESVTQQDAGKITAKAEDKVKPADAARDQVKVSKTEEAKKDAAKAAAATEDKIAAERALKEAQERVSLLEKNVGDLQNLLSMKNQQLADLQAQKKNEVKPEPKPEVKPEEKPAAAPEPAKPAAPEVPPAEAVKPPAPEPEKAVEPPKPEAPKVADVPKPVPPKPPVEAEPEEEPGLLDSMLQDPTLLLGGAGIAALLGAYAVVRRRRQPPAPATTAMPNSDALGANSVFRNAGGQSVDTGNTSPMTNEFSQAGPGTIDTDDVDPVAEADVYMAYGRDAQAEEILVEALQKDPGRTAIHVKLLEIYAGRKSLKQFETLASELYALTGGVGPDWAKAVQMGAQLDPSNPLFSGATATQSPFAADATLVAAPAAVFAAALSEPPADIEPPAPEALPSEPELSALEPEPFVPTPVPEAPLAYEPPPASLVDTQTLSQVRADMQERGEDLQSLDFDLGEALTAAVEAPAEIDVPEPVVEPASAPADEAFDFELDMPAVSEPPIASEPLTVEAPGGESVDTSALEPEDVNVAALPDIGTAIDFDLDLSKPLDAPPAPLDIPPPAALPLDDLALPDAAPVPASEVAADDIDFDVDLSDSVFLGEPGKPEVDLGSINLDLDAPPATSEPMPAATAPDVAPAAAEAAPIERDAQWEEVNTKLDLAKAYEEMGDLDGARELLQEVVGEGSADLVEQARTILDRIGG